MFRRPSPAEKQMALTSPAVGCAETGNRCLHIRPPADQMGEGALIAIGADQGGAACGALGQPVDMPMAGFPLSEMTGDAGAKATWPVGAAAIEIKARTQARFRQGPNGKRKGFLDFKSQEIGSGLGRHCTKVRLADKPNGP